MTAFWCRLEGRNGRVTPHRLAWLPDVAPVSPEPAFSAADRAEWSGDLTHSLNLLRTTLADSRPSVQGGALLRQARILRKSVRWPEALRIYGQLAGLGSILIEGLPAEAIAHQARFAILEQIGSTREARQEAAALGQGLAVGRWMLSEASFGFYLEEAMRGTGRAQHALIPEERFRISAALQRAWTGKDDGERRRLVSVDRCSWLFLRVGSEAEPAFLLLGPQWLERNWRAPLAANVAGRGIELGLTTPDGVPVLRTTVSQAASVRFSSATRLPWDVRAVTLHPETEISAANVRRQLMWTALLTATLLVVAASILIVRSITRDMTISRLQSDFVSAVSHEFRTPLTSLCQISELLSAGRVPGETDRVIYYGILTRESHRLRRLVEGLLDFGRMEAGAREYRFERINLCEFATEVATEFSAKSAPPDAARLQVHAFPAGTVRADRTALACVIWNLLDNAMKYAGDRGSVRLKTGIVGDQAFLSVEDDGPGIPLAEQSRIFEKFVRGDAAREAGVRGSGVGLSMLKHIVEAHRGEVHLKSAVGRGSTFIVVLPGDQNGQDSHSRR